MTKTRDTYKTITKPSPETLFKERGSKFYNYAFPVQDEDEIKDAIDSLKKTHHAINTGSFSMDSLRTTSIPPLARPKI